MDFYKYIQKAGDSYRILKDNEHYGTYSKLSDALYERDRLVQSDWCWDDVLQLEETENFYEKMVLPKFVSEFSYIYEIYQSYEVYKDDEFRGKFNNKKDAKRYAESINGTIIPTKKKYLVQKSINGKQVHFGSFKTFEEAKKRRDELMANNWIVYYD